MRSLSLYSSLGFEVTTPCVVVSGQPRSAPDDAVTVRPVTEDDLEECAALCERVHGFARTGALRDAVHAMAPFAALRDGRIVAYASAVGFWPMAHGAGETDDDHKALLLGAAATTGEPIALLVPLRSEVFRWALREGLRAVKPMNIMVRGEYREPQGAWFPSVLY
ncbi:MAG: hypothetical protein M3141_00560 [Actinomycetota bacterium]|nr:hypothetical protein [Actinomycetota bacterium]